MIIIKPQMLRAVKFPNTSINLLLRHHFQSLTTALPQPINEAHLLRVCTVLYQQQNAPNTKLHSSLTKTCFELNHEFFLQVCNKFPCSWRPIYRFHLFSIAQPNFAHTPTTFNKILDIVGKSRNVDLLWDLSREVGRLRLVNVKTYVVVLRTLAAARELKKCVEFYHLMNGFGYGYEIGTLNKVLEHLCRNKLVSEAKHVVDKLRDWVKPDCESYRWLIYGFCDVGDLIEASRVWNSMVDDGFDPDINAVEVMIETLFKNNKFVEGFKLFHEMRVKRMECLGVSTYRLLIKWLCKKGKMGEAHVVFDELSMRGLKPDNEILGWMIYGLVSRGRTNEAYKVMEGVENADISMYHGMIKGLLKLKKPAEATQVFREMIKRGCEPTMHTYVMLLQGHLGKRGRKGEDPLVNFDTIFVGGLVKAGKPLDAGKYVERVMDRGIEVPRFDYNKFLHLFSNEEGAVMFGAMAMKLKEVGLFDLADIFYHYGERMATRDRRRSHRVVPMEDVSLG